MRSEQMSPNDWLGYESAYHSSRSFPPDVEAAEKDKIIGVDNSESIAVSSSGTYHNMDVLAESGGCSRR
jgi:hypothetical protein